MPCPQGMPAVANAKSSTGRLDLLTRTITDGGIEFDRMPEAIPARFMPRFARARFSVLVRPGMRLNQIRFRQGHAVLDDDELARAARPHARWSIGDGGD